jgi:hypothetical protein
MIERPSFLYEGAKGNGKMARGKIKVDTSSNKTIHSRPRTGTGR